MDSEVVQKIQAALGCGRLGRGHFNRGGTGAGGGELGHLPATQETQKIRTLGLPSFPEPSRTCQGPAWGR